MNSIFLPFKSMKIETVVAKSVVYRHVSSNMDDMFCH